MNRFAILITLIAIFAAGLAPVMNGLCPHHGEAEVLHATQDDHCGCVCHGSVNAVAVTDGIEVHLVSTATEHYDDHSRPDPISASIDRPPELCS